MVDTCMTQARPNDSVIWEQFVPSNVLHRSALPTEIAGTGLCSFIHFIALPPWGGAGENDCRAVLEVVDEVTAD